MTGQEAAAKKKAFVKVVPECDAKGNILPSHLQKDIYWVFLAEFPYTFVCASSSLGDAMGIARAEHGCYFDGDPQAASKPKAPKV